jgi:hypothetical protein
MSTTKLDAKRRWALENPEKVRASRRKWVEGHRKERSATRRKHYQKNIERIREYRRDLNKRYKLEVMGHYSNGNIKCNCCGEADIRFLCLDHINGGGNRERATIGHIVGSSFYKWLRARGFPPGIQVLCYNCNMAKGVSKECPHKQDLLTRMRGNK